MRALVTRPIEDAAPLAEALKARGIEPVLAPLMTVRAVGNAPPLDGIAALLFSSANGVRAFSSVSDRRDLPCFTVGQATAEAARKSGFARVENAGGNVDSLASLVAQRLTPSGGPLLHIAGTEVAGDLAGQLTRQGFTVERAVLYEATPVALLPLAVIEDIKAGRIDCVLLFSPRTATLLTERIRKAGLESAMGKITALCLSKAVADAATLPFAAKRVATQADQASLLALLDSKEAPARAGTPRPSLPPPPPRDSSTPARAVNPIVAGGLAGLVVAGIVAGIAALTAPSWMPQQAGDKRDTARLAVLEQQVQQLKSAPAPTTDLQPLAARITALEQSVASLRSQPASASNADQLAPLQSKLAELDQAMRGSADARTVSDLTDRIATLTQQMTALQQQTTDLVKNTQGEVARTAEAATHRTALALATSGLAQALGAGQPFAPVLRSVLGLNDDSALKTQLTALQPFAERGIPTVDALARQFPTLAREAKAASIEDAAGGGWYGRMRALFGRLVTIRATDPARGGSDLDNRLARAGAHLESRDLASAVAEMKDLPPAGKNVAAGWLADADARLRAEAAVTALDAQTVAGVAQQGH